MLPVVHNEDDNGILISLIYELDQFSKFNNFITYFGDQKQNLGSIQQSLIDTFYRPMMVGGPEIGTITIAYDWNLMLVLFNGINDPLLDSVANSVVNNTNIKFIFVYEVKDNLLPERSFMEHFFKWCCEKQMIHSLLFLKHDKTYEIWAYVVKPKIALYKITIEYLRKTPKETFRKVIDMEKAVSFVVFYKRLPDAFYVSTHWAC